MQQPPVLSSPTPAAEVSTGLVLPGGVRVVEDHGELDSPPALNGAAAFPGSVTVQTVAAAVAPVGGGTRPWGLHH